MNFNEHNFKHCLASFATGVTVVSTMDGAVPYGVTVNAFCSVSLAPPLVLFCLDKGASCFPVYEKAEYFCINMLSLEQESLSRRFSHDQQVPWQDTAYTAGHMGCPIITNHLAFLECRKWASYDGGDHQIFIGEVKHLSVAIAGEKEPLIYYKSQYHTIGNESGNV